MSQSKQFATFNTNAHPYLSQHLANRISDRLASGKSMPGWYGYQLSEGCAPFTFSLMTQKSHKSPWYIAAQKANWKNINSTN